MSQQQLASDFMTELWREFESTPKLVIVESESGDDSAPEEEGPLSYARIFAPYSPPRTQRRWSTSMINSKRITRPFVSLSG